jgi:hypothetical protein
MRKLFERSKEVDAVLRVYLGMAMSQSMSYVDMAAAVGFSVNHGTYGYAAAGSARAIAAKQHKVYIGVMRGYGIFRGTATDTAHSVSPLLKRANRTLKKTVNRADLAFGMGNLPESEHYQLLEERNRASIAESMTRAVKAVSNATRPAPVAPNRSPSPYATLPMGK